MLTLLSGQSGVQEDLRSVGRPYGTPHTGRRVCQGTTPAPKPHETHTYPGRIGPMMGPSPRIAVSWSQPLLRPALGSRSPGQACRKKKKLPVSKALMISDDQGVSPECDVVPWVPS